MFQAALARRGVHVGIVLRPSIFDLRGQKLYDLPG
jgi:hypothetical protein